MICDNLSHNLQIESSSSTSELQCSLLFHIFVFVQCSVPTSSDLFPQARMSDMFIGLSDLCSEQSSSHERHRLLFICLCVCKYMLYMYFGTE
jgi:hypothetical protein